MSRKVQLKRKEIIRHGFPQEFKEDKICNLGSYLDKNGNTFRPLTFEEENKYMEAVVSLKITDPGFRKACNEYYKNLTIKVGFRGVELEAGLDEFGNPLNLEDYIKYKFAESHPWMAKDRKECEAIEHYQFYFEDPEADRKVKGDKLEFISKAYVEFSKLVEDEEKMDWAMRSVLGKFPELGSITDLIKLKPKDKKLKLAEVVEKDPAYFIQVIDDKDLVYKAEIASMIEAGVLAKEGNKYLNGSENLGSLDGTIAWIKDQNNSVEYAILKARLDELGTPLFVKPKVKAKA